MRDGSTMAVMKVAFLTHVEPRLSDDTGVPGAGVEGSREGLMSQNANSNNQLVFALNLTLLCMFATLNQTW